MINKKYKIIIIVLILIIIDVLILLLMQGSTYATNISNIENKFDSIINNISDEEEDKDKEKDEEKEYHIYKGNPGDLKGI